MGRRRREGEGRREETESRPFFHRTLRFPKPKQKEGGIGHPPRDVFDPFSPFPHHPSDNPREIKEAGGVLKKKKRRQSHPAPAYSCSGRRRAVRVLTPAGRRASSRPQLRPFLFLRRPRSAASRVGLLSPLPLLAGGRSTRLSARYSGSSTRGAPCNRNSPPR